MVSGAVEVAVIMEVKMEEKTVEVVAKVEEDEAVDYSEVKKVVVFEAALLVYMNTNQTALMDSINESGDYNDDIAAQLQAAIDDFKANNTW